MAFGAIYNPSLGHSYLLSYGNWIPRPESSGVDSTVVGSSYTFTDQYDGALVRWKNRKVTSLFASTIPVDARLYIGFADGGYDWLRLVPYPLALDAGSVQGAEYTQDESYLVMPLHHAMFQADTKHWTGTTVFGPLLAAGDSVLVGYRVKGSQVGPGAAADGGFLSFGDRLTEIGMRCDCVNQMAGQAIEVQIAFDSASTSSTPILEGLGLHERLVPRFRRDYTLTINASDFVTRRDGAAVRQSGVFIRQLLENAAAAPSALSLMLPDERVNEVALFSYEEHQVPHNQRGGLGWAITAQATQFTTLSVYGIIGRLRGTLIGDLRGYPISALRTM
jgi:hypothetical protein